MARNTGNLVTTILNFRKHSRNLKDLLAAEFDGNPLIEWMDLMQYGFWGEGHTSNYPSPFPDYPTAERTFAQHDGAPTQRMEENTACSQYTAGHQQRGQSAL